MAFIHDYDKRANFTIKPRLWSKFVTYKGILFNCLGGLFMLNWIGGERCSSTCDVNIRKGYWLFCGCV